MSGRGVMLIVIVAYMSCLWLNLMGLTAIPWIYIACLPMAIIVILLWRARERDS